MRAVFLLLETAQDSLLVLGSDIVLVTTDAAGHRDLCSCFRHKSISFLSIKVRLKVYHI